MELADASSAYFDPLTVPPLMWISPLSAEMPRLYDVTVPPWMCTAVLVIAALTLMAWDPDPVLDTVPPWI